MNLIANSESIDSFTENNVLPRLKVVQSKKTLSCRVLHLTS